MSRIGVMGASGRMGQEVKAQLESSQTDLSFSTGAARKGLGFAKSVEEWDSANIDAVIDFSLPSATDDLIPWCVKYRKPLVSGTTGLSEKQIENFKQAGQQIPILWSPNMSIGVAVLKRALAAFSAIPQFDYAIEEFHHSKKVDQPSGTALHLKQALESCIGREVSQVSAIRGGGIYGIHSVFAMSDEEVVEFKHTALNRRVFAAGAVKACEWLLKQKAGFYSLDDMIATNR